MDKNRYLLRLVSIIGVSFVLASCSAGQAQPSQPDYRNVKTMVLDIMETEDAKKALSRMLQDEKIKSQMMVDSETVRSTLIKTMASPSNTHLKEAFKDPKFASTLGKSMKEENRKLLKELMKDPDYQKMMLDIMKDPEFEKNQLQLMKSAAYRHQTMQVMKESLQSPLFQEEMMKIMTKVTEEMIKPKTKKKGGGGEGGGTSGGGGSPEGGGS